MEFILSASFTLSSSAPFTIVLPFDNDASTNIIGSSSIMPGIISLSIVIPLVLEYSATISPAGSKRFFLLIIFMRPPILESIFKMPALVGFIEMFLIFIDEPFKRSAPTKKKLALDMSPGTSKSLGVSSISPFKKTLVPLMPIFAPKVLSILSVWSRESAGSVNRVSPRAWSPARSTADLTWALATRLRQRMGRSGNRPDIFRGARPPGRDRTPAPIFDRGSITRFMGLRDRDASPERTERKGRPARTPERRRMVVPELPQSRFRDGRRHGRRRPSVFFVLDSGITIFPAATRTGTPRAWRQPSVERQSPDKRGRRITDRPGESAPRIMARWVMDLSGGGDTLPLRDRPRSARGAMIADRFTEGEAPAGPFSNG